MLRSASKLGHSLLKACELRSVNVLPSIHTASILNNFNSLKKGEYEFPEANANFEVSTAEWKYVERLMPMKLIPKPKATPGETMPSGWIAPKAKRDDYPYFVTRNRNHLFRLHMDADMFTQKVRTKVKGIEGDIYLFAKELQAHLLRETGKLCVVVRVAESFGTISFKGDYQDLILEYLYKKGF